MKCYGDILLLLFFSYLFLWRCSATCIPGCHTFFFLWRHTHGISVAPLFWSGGAWQLALKFSWLCPSIKALLYKSPVDPHVLPSIWCHDNTMLYDRLLNSWLICSSGNPGLPKMRTEVHKRPLAKKCALTECHSGMWKNAVPPLPTLPVASVLCQHSFSPVRCLGSGSCDSSQTPIINLHQAVWPFALIPGAVWLLSHTALRMMPFFLQYTQSDRLWWCLMVSQQIPFR